jgi:hypothetical protein
MPFSLRLRADRLRPLLRVAALGELLEDLRAERRQVVGLACGET